eukprot:503940-Hanusia_phi.AAC.1
MLNSVKASLQLQVRSEESGCKEQEEWGGGVGRGREESGMSGGEGEGGCWACFPCWLVTCCVAQAVGVLRNLTVKMENKLTVVQ